MNPDDIPAPNMLGIYDDSFIEEYKKLTDMVHSVMFRIKNNELRGILTAIACGIFGLMISAYGNAFFFQFPTGFIIILFLSVLINGEHIDQLLTQQKMKKK